MLMLCVMIMNITILLGRAALLQKRSVELKEGPLDQFTHEMEPFLRKQGMPVRLNKGVVELVGDFVVCEEGKLISPESSRILVCFQDSFNIITINVFCITWCVHCSVKIMRWLCSVREVRLVDMKMATLKLNLICRWSPEDFELYQEGLEGSDIESA
ncbi:putative 60S ribosomal protein L10P, insertion [Helianthus annuus]|nr:putative 60S ribosomal protein L10P, insertion [Helianthus annuus]